MDGRRGLAGRLAIALDDPAGLVLREVWSARRNHLRMDEVRLGHAWIRPEVLEEQFVTHHTREKTVRDLPQA